jgi:hypothetical protein
MYIRFTTVAGNFGNRRNCDRNCGNPSKDGSKFRKHRVSIYKDASLSINKLGAFVFFASAALMVYKCCVMVSQ